MQPASFRCRAYASRGTAVDKSADQHLGAAGRLVTLEGVDGCGKSTQARLLARALELAGCTVLLLREPGGVELSEKIRGLLLDPANANMSATCELLLYEAARAQLVHEVIAPALAAGVTVVCDRFYDSTTAYQGYAAGLGADTVRAANELAVAGCHPDLTLVYELPVAEAHRRAYARAAADRMEAKGLAYQERVAEGFAAVAAAEPVRVHTVDARGSVAAVLERTCAEVERALGMSVDAAARAQALAEAEGAPAAADDTVKVQGVA